MSSIRKFTFAAFLALTTLNFAPSLASAQVAQGSFTLSHNVHWQNANVPAGEYRFSYDSGEPLGVLMLTKRDGGSGGYVIMVPGTDPMEGSGPDRLVLNTSASGSYVSDMQLPGFGVTLHFRPPKATEKQMARAAATTMAAAQ